ncbi:M23 family metallopeptidase [Nesterenkonia muleiensis]|uniref:M23 family metallopeptidase n=1 Tax=Nesterenkonia muleiensis TaxID=2282648 RepID=UPI000E7381FA|nr:M23 family metallopeptidase [Nesterenkonia muleiensis]
MRRAIAALGPLWRVLLLTVILAVVLDLTGVIDPPGGGWWVLFVVALGLGLVMAISIGPSARSQKPVEVHSPVRGRWLALNSPGQAIPSHGTAKLGQLSAVDIIHPSDQSAEHVNPARMSWALMGERPERFSCFGAPIHSMAAGAVVRVNDWQRDQRGRNSWPSYVFFSTLENVLRSLAGPAAIIGNRVVIQHDDDICSAYAHLRRGSAKVSAGQRVEAGQVIAEVGNTGNTTQPHLHVQLMDRVDFEAAAGVPMIWRNIELEGVASGWEKFAKEPAHTALSGMPRNGQIFRTVMESGPGEQSGASSLYAEQ